MGMCHKDKGRRLSVEGEKPGGVNQREEKTDED